MTVLEYRNYLWELNTNNTIHPDIYYKLLNSFDDICVSYIAKIPHITHEYTCSECKCHQPTDMRLDFLYRYEIDYCYGCGVKFVKDIIV